MGSLVLTSIVKTSATLDLTASSTDWSLIGGSNIKSPGPSTITITPASPSSFSGFGRTSTWTDGTPTASGSTADGFFVQTVGVGQFVITAPASTTAQKIVLSAGGFNAQCRVQASLSDASASAISYSGTDFDWTSSFGSNQIEIDYAANSGGQTITVTLDMVSGSGGPTVNLQSVKLMAGSGAEEVLSGSAVTSGHGTQVPGHSIPL